MSNQSVEGVTTDIKEIERPLAEQVLSQLVKLVALVDTVRGEQISDSIFGGRTTATKRGNSEIYAARINAAASQIDDVLDEAKLVIEKAEANGLG